MHPVRPCGGHLRMTESEFLDKKRWYELRIRAHVRAGRYAAIKSYLKEPGPGPQLSIERLRILARGYE